MKNIVITGAANGIGYYLVKQLLSESYNVTVLDLETDNLSSLCEEYDSLLSMACDVRDLKQVDDCVRESVKKYGSIDCAIHNACLCTFESMEQTKEETYRDVMEVNYFGALHLSQAVLPYMKSQKKGKVIFTSSGVGVTGFLILVPMPQVKVQLKHLLSVLTSSTKITVSVFILSIRLLQELNQQNLCLFQKNIWPTRKKLESDLQNI